MRIDSGNRRTLISAALMAAGLATTLAFILACGGAPKQSDPLPVSRWGESFNYSFQPPQQAKAASVRINVVVVNPFYREPESAFMEAIYAKVGRGFSRSMGVDLDKIIVAKGMTAVGPYATLDDVTFPDKKAGDLTLAPRVFLTSQIRYGEQTRTDYGGVGYYSRPFTMKVGGWVAYEMREPLSGQKMWIKRLDLDDREVRDVEIHEAVAARKDNYGNVTSWNVGELRYNGREEAIANALRDYYPQIMQRAWTYLNTEEMLELKEKTKEIRERVVAPMQSR